MLQYLFSIKRLVTNKTDPHDLIKITSADDIKRQINQKFKDLKSIKICLKDFLFLLICFLLSFTSLHEGYEKINANILATDEWQNENKFAHLADSKIIYGLLVSSFYISQGISSLLVNLFVYKTYNKISKQKLINLIIFGSLLFNYAGSGMCVGSRFWVVFIFGKILQGFSVGINAVVVPVFIKFFVVDESTQYLAGIGTNLCSMNSKNGTMTGYIILYCCKKWYKNTNKVWIYPNISPFVFSSIVAIGLAIFNCYYLPYLYLEEKTVEKLESKKIKADDVSDKEDYAIIFTGKKKTVIFGLLIVTFYSLNSLNYFLCYNNKEFTHIEADEYDFSGLIYATIYTIGGNLSSAIPYSVFLKNDNKNIFSIYRNTLKYISFLCSLIFVVIITVGYAKKEETERTANKYLKTVFAFGNLVVFLQTTFLEISLSNVMPYLKILNDIDLFQLLVYTDKLSDMVILVITPLLNQNIGFLMCIIFAITSMLLALTPIQV